MRSKTCGDGRATKLRPRDSRGGENPWNGMKETVVPRVSNPWPLLSHKCSTGEKPLIHLFTSVSAAVVTR